MQSEPAKKTTFEETSEKLDRGNERALFEKALDAVKGDQRNYAGTVYAAQQANIRNYLWLSSLLMTADIALFANTEIAATTLDVLRGNQSLAFSFALTLILQASAAICVASAFLLCVRSGTGTDRYEHTSNLYGNMRAVSRERAAYAQALNQKREKTWTEAEATDFLAVSLRDETEDLKRLIEETANRGEALRKIGMLILTATVHGILAAICYGAFCL